MIEFGIKDVIDIVLVATMLYYAFRVMRESRSLNIFVGIMIFIAMWIFVTQVLEIIPCSDQAAEIIGKVPEWKRT